MRGIEVFLKNATSRYSDLYARKQIENLNATMPVAL